MNNHIGVSRALMALVGLVLITGSVFAAGSGEVADGEKVIIIRASGDPMSFNPDLAADDNAYPVVQNIYNRLVKLDASKQAIPDLATSWDVSDDALTITFYLREGMTWHDGESVTSADVVYTFEQIQENSTSYFSSSMAIVDSISAPDDYTVVFHMNQADVSFVARLGWYATFIMPKHIYDNGMDWADNPANMSPIGSGPFKFSDYQQGQSITLVANENYYVVPKLDRVIYSIIPDDATAVQALVNGEIDVLESIPTANVSELQANPDISMTLNEYPSPQRIIFNLNAPEVQDLAIRQAIAYAMDREEISTKVFGNINPPEYNFYPSMIEWATNDEDSAPRHDTEAAIAILEDAGYSKNSDGFYVTGLTIDVFEGYGYSDTARLLKAQLAEAGIDLTVQVHEFNAWYQKVGGDRNFILEMQGGFMGPDPAALATRFGSESGTNYAAYSNPEFDQVLAEAAATGDRETRASLYKRAQTYLSEDIPYLPITAYAAYDASNARFINLPIDGAGKWGWQELTYTDIVD